MYLHPLLSPPNPFLSFMTSTRSTIPFSFIAPFSIFSSFYSVHQFNSTFGTSLDHSYRAVPPPPHHTPHIRTHCDPNPSRHATSRHTHISCNCLYIGAILRTLFFHCLLSFSRLSSKSLSFFLLYLSVRLGLSSLNRNLGCMWTRIEEILQGWSTDFIRRHDRNLQVERKGESLFRHHSTIRITTSKQASVLESLREGS